MSIFRVINLRMGKLISLNNSGESSGKSNIHRMNVFFSMNRVNRFPRDLQEILFRGAPCCPL